MANNAAASYWDFIDETVKNNVVALKISSRGFDGDSMIAELKQNPIIDFGQFKIDFNEKSWTLKMTGVETSRHASYQSGAVFDDDSEQSNDVWKLYLLCSLIWKTNKTHTCIAYYQSAKKMFHACGGTNARTSVLDCEACKNAFADLEATLGASTLRRCATTLKMFLDFQKAFFKISVSPEIESFLLRIAKKAINNMIRQERTPAIDDGYLVPLVSTCQRVLKDGNEDEDSKVTAAVLLLVSQVGMRISEASALNTGSLSVSHVDGKEDIAYLTFKVFKDVPGDTGYKTAHSVINQLAAEAYLWLETNCAERREKKNTDSLIVFPKQRTAYPTGEMMRHRISIFLLTHHSEIPCVNTQDTFPDLQICAVSQITKKAKTLDLEALGLNGTETLVYPKFHSFRATVATKLYEAGVDMRYIRKHMSHINENTTAGYIRSDREIERQNSELVYKTILEDGAQMIGPHGNEFMNKVNAYIETLPEHVKDDMDAVVEAASTAFPLRRKVGGVCIRCGKIVPCKRNDETDQIYCAFGVCPNQCCLYFMAADCLNTVKIHMSLVDANVERNHVKAARNELRKAQNVIRDCLMPELDSLDQQINKLGRDGVLERFPELEEIVNDMDNIRKETEQWLNRTI